MRLMQLADSFIIKLLLAISYYLKMHKFQLCGKAGKFLTALKKSFIKINYLNSALILPQVCRTPEIEGVTETISEKIDSAPFLSIILIR